MYEALSGVFDAKNAEFKGFLHSPSDNMDYAVVFIPMKPDKAKEVKNNEKSRGKKAKE